MKKLILTFVLLSSFAFSYANDSEKKSEDITTDQTKIEVQKSEVNTTNVAQPAAMYECYQLSCGTYCFTNGFEEEPGCDIECIFDVLEYVFCYG